MLVIVIAVRSHQLIEFVVGTITANSDIELLLSLVLVSYFIFQNASVIVIILQKKEES